jgi:predicted amidohydrolase
VKAEPFLLILPNNYHRSPISMKIALASPPFPKSIDDGLFWAEKLTKEAAEQGAEIICFPESYIPGYPAEEFTIEPHSQPKLEQALNHICEIAKQYHIAMIVPMDWENKDGFFNVAFVVSNHGEVMGYQTKNQLDPSEDNRWVPGTERHIFEVNGLRFGIVICHEGFRYPETVRWAARRGAKIVFHPHFAGSNLKGVIPTVWGHPDNPYYEKAMTMRSIENSIYFASVNNTTDFPESATSLIAPDGKYIAHQPYGKIGVLVADINPELATGYLANRLKAELYPDTI